MTKQPVLTIASVQAVIAAIISALVLFNVWHPTDDQVAAVLGLYAVLAPIVFGLLARSKVTPVAPPV